MNQLIFPFADETAPRLDDFLGAANRELVHTLQQGIDPQVYVWGPAGAGKTHLLKAWTHQAIATGGRALYIGDNKNDLSLDLTHQFFSHIAIDDVHLCQRKTAGQLFTLFNHWREQGVFMLFSAAMAPLALPLRDDVKARLSWGLTYEVHLLNDAEKFAALQALANQRQLYIDDDILHYLITHLSRDIQQLTHTLIALDDYAVKLSRRLTIPLIKAYLQEHHDS